MYICVVALCKILYGLFNRSAGFSATLNSSLTIYLNKGVLGSVLFAQLYLSVGEPY